VSLVAAIPNDLIVEHFLDTQILNIMELFDNPVRAKKEILRPKALPGHEIEFNEKKIAKHLKPARRPLA
jgi:L-alanine-DL-glutamate epimerase-like enolase superfamily enzyme